MPLYPPLRRWSSNSDSVGVLRLPAIRMAGGRKSAVKACVALIALLSIATSGGGFSVGAQPSAGDKAVPPRHGIGRRLLRRLLTTDCGPGYTGPGDSDCTPCEAGEYKPSSGSSACLPCPPGNYSSVDSAASSCVVCPTGSTSDAGSQNATECTCMEGHTGEDGEICSQCTIGEYKAENGSAPCDACPDNSATQDAGATAMSQCDCIAGYSGPGADNCTACPSATYSETSGAAACTPCQGNSSTPEEGSSAASDCVCTATFYEVDGECPQCPIGSYCSGGAAITACPSGSTSPAGSAASSDCFCPDGWKDDSGVLQGSCVECGVGTWCAAGVETQCPDFSTSEALSNEAADCVCTAGYFGPDGGTCAECSDNSFCLGGTEATPCGASMASTDGSAAVDSTACSCVAGFFGTYDGGGCGTCEANHFCEGGATQTACPDFSTSSASSEAIGDCACIGGYKRVDNACEPCGEDTWCAAGVEHQCPTDSSSEALSNEAGDCVCDAAFVGPNGGTCAACPANSYCTGGAAATSCGTHATSALGSDQASDCDCVSGYYGSSGACTVCPDNTDASAGSTLVGECTCVAGFTAAGDGVACSACLAGSYKGATGPIACTLCDAGKFSGDASGATSVNTCQTCGQDQTSDPGASVCGCDLGYTGADGGPCSQCGEGTYKGTIGSVECTTCGDNSFSNAGSTASSDCSCAAGNTFVVDACVACEPGTFKASNGAGACMPCQQRRGGVHVVCGWEVLGGDGRASNGAGACTLCDAGKYSGATGATSNVCIACPFFSSTSSTGSSVVTDCSCIAGYIGTVMTASSTCSPCPAGYLQTTPGSTSCDPCPSGKYNPNEGGDEDADCITCPLFSTADSPAESIVECYCNAGYTGPNGQQCTPCAAGTYKNTTGTDSCDACGNATYSTTSGATSDAVCIECPYEAFASEGAGALALCTCNAGYEGDAGTGANCTACRQGSYKATLGAGPCTPCRGGTYSSDFAAENGDTCDPCPDNAYSPAGSGTAAVAHCSCNAGYSGTISTVDDACTICPAGSFKDTNGTADCSLCPAGTYFGGSGAFSDSQCAGCPASSNVAEQGSTSVAACLCDPGTFGDPSTDPPTPCEPCGQGTFSAASGQLSCDSCPDNSDGGDGGSDISACSCDAGYYGELLNPGDTCSACPTNTFLTTSGATSITQCEACPVDSASPGSSTAKSACLCNRGYFGDPETNQACQACPENKYQDLTGRTSVSACQPCTANSQSLPHATDIAQCECNAGYTGNAGTGTCTGCAADTYKAAKGSDACTTCPTNSLTDPASSGGATSSDQATDCVCDEGYYGPLGGVSPPCEKCPIGTYSGAIGLILVGECVTCPQNSTTEVAGQRYVTQCVCDLGYFGTVTDADATECAACPVNTYQPTLASWQDVTTSCIDCTANSASPQASPAIASCTCNTGYTGNPGASSGVCTPCPLATYNTDTSQHDASACTGCPEFATTLQTASNALAQCLCNVGYEGDPVNSVACVACAPGEYNSVVGGVASPAEACQACNANSYSPEASVEQTACTCNAGYFGQAGGSCTGCPIDTYNSLTNQDTEASCLACPAESASPGASDALADCLCNPGHFGSPVLSVVCNACPTATFNPTRGNTSSEACLACPEHATNDGAADALSDCVCDVGFYGSPAIADPCVACPEGTFNEERDGLDVADCQACPDDSDAPAGNTLRTGCTCNLGFYGSPGVSCTQCPVNAFRDSRNGTVVADCAACPNNSSAPLASDSVADCVCDPGFWGDPAHGVACLPCAPGSYNGLSNQTQASACILCPTSSTTLMEAQTEVDHCVCLPGFYGEPGAADSCDACPADTFNEEHGSTARLDCNNCTDDSFSPSGSGLETACTCNVGYTGADGGPCAACLPGLYKNTTGSADCTACPFESSSPEASDDIHLCTCNKGYTGPDGSACVACLPTFYKGIEGASECIQCEAFTYSPPASRNLSMCACVPGFFGNLGGPCAECPEDTYKESFGNASCAECPDNSFSRNASALLTNCSCVEGHFGPPGGPCTQCPAATYKDYTGNQHVGNALADCRVCPNNTWSSASSVYVTECVCVAGYTGEDGTSCTACPVDQFKPVNGSSSCSICPTNQTSILASTHITDCKCVAGYTGPDGGECTICPEHFHKAAIGPAACTACPANTFTEDEGTDDVKDCLCLVGYNATRLGVACSLCPVATWKNTTGSTACSACPAHSLTYPGEVNLINCLCAPGYSGPDGEYCESCLVGDYKETRGSAACSDCVPCDTGGWSNCTKIYKGGCVDCTGPPEFANFSGSGILTSATLDEWEIGSNCRKTIVRPDGGLHIVVLAERCYKTWGNDTCPVECSEGAFKVGEQLCKECNTSECGAGFYRGACAPLADSVCSEECDNAIPANAEYSSGGMPFDENNCSWTCLTGHYPTSDDTCLACEDDLSLKPGNASYTAPGAILDLAICPWGCDGNYTENGMACVFEDPDDRCREDKCPFPEVRSGAGGATKLYNPCYEFEYPSCADDDFDPLAPAFSRNLTCHSCLGLITVNQGGWTYRYFEGCPIGQFRGPCRNECVFPDAGNVRGQCLNCTNAQSAHVVYTSVGNRRTNACEWTCASGYTKTTLYGREQCV
ncbi:hypothetical protein T484DRAFT_1882630 [Baffinella frigidus]|nr:hypothetical protein T484DRAFT_1882630 [Cryptophyta sp. CCMP2293]